MPSDLQVDQIKSADGNTTYLNSGTLSNLTFPSGHVLQVVASLKTDRSSTESTSLVDVTGTDQDGAGSIWCCKITPSSTSSKILVNISFTWSYGASSSATNRSASAKLYRDSTEIGVGTSAGSRTTGFAQIDGRVDHYYYNVNQVGFSWLDSPSSTSELTYKMKYGITYNGANELSLGGDLYNADTTQSNRTGSSLILHEIAG